MRFVVSLFLICVYHCLNAQVDTTSSQPDLFGNEEETDYTIATFKTTRLMNGHSIENQASGVMDFRINHRFGRINGGPYELFGLDQAYVKLGFDFGITDRIMIGVGRTNVQKSFDGFAKVKILRQSKGKKNMPISMSWVTGSTLVSEKWNNLNRTNYFSSRLAYFHQLIIARKFNNAISWQMSPFVVHKNLIDSNSFSNDLFGISIGGRHKLSQRVSINLEYYHLLNSKSKYPSQLKNSLAIGFDIETGGHVFQLHFTNSRGMNETQFITETTGNWLKADIQFGFNVSRVFTYRQPKEFR